MKNFTFPLLCLLLSIQSYAQYSQSDKTLALELIEKNRSVLKWSVKDFENIELSSTYFRAETGIRMVYLQQTYSGIRVFNKMLILAFKDDKLVSQTGGFLSSIGQRVNIKDAVPKITARVALQSVFNILGIGTPGDLKFTEESTAGLKVFTSVSNVEIKVMKLWVPVNEKDVRLAWQVEIAPVKTADHWLIRIDAENANEINRNNYTVQEKFNESNQHVFPKTDLRFQKAADEGKTHFESPAAVTSATYRVIPFPYESPLHYGSGSALVSDPWTMAPGNATTLQWHFDGSTFFDSTRGNNVLAQEDRDNNNNTFGRMATSSTAQPSLTLNYLPNYTLAPTTTTFQRFATTNLFYWNNIMHDVLYQYGFDEVSGNFQYNNLGRGGAEVDLVIADAQDGGGTNNANFTTPEDGYLPRMQMYLGTYTSPNRDGDLDNGVISHEYAHGLSNRLTGGPANSSCLYNTEQGGEGWSDYVALMVTTNWATATVNDGALSRPIGNYLFGQTISGPGIRTYPYSTNMSINPNTYAMMASTTGSVHRIGEIWCSALWDMTWGIIETEGINTNIFNAAGTGGNSIALKLVVEGMRLQPCNPGFIDARNAILRADTILYNGKYSCAIWKAFARRGMGRFASQGSSNSTTDQVADFTENGGIKMELVQSVAAQHEGLHVTYTNVLTAGNCGAISGLIIRDTLPANVTYVSGGTYDSASRVVSFPVNVLIGESQSYSFTVRIKTGSYYPSVTLIDEVVPDANISSIWTPTSTTAVAWTTSSYQSNSAPYSLFTGNNSVVSDQRLTTTNAYTLYSQSPYLSFMGYINSETNWDGGVVEISNNNGSTWSDLGPLMVYGGYNSTISSGQNPLASRWAFTGNSEGFVRTVIDLKPYAGQSVKLRFRFGSDETVGEIGWYVDDIQLKDVARVFMRSCLFNSSNVKLLNSDTITIILPCAEASIIEQPNDIAVCSGDSVSFSINAVGTSLTYQWQKSENGGISFTNITGANQPALHLHSVTYALNGTQYRCVIEGACTASMKSLTATLTVNQLPQAPTAINNSRCGIGNVVISANPGAGEVIDWYDSSIGGAALQLASNQYSVANISSTAVYYAQSVNQTTGCASSVRTPVSAIINFPTSSSADVVTCGSYNWNGNVYTNSGVYSYTSVNSAGCDSLMTLHLTINNNSQSVQSVTACDSYYWNGANYTESGSYTYTAENASGCDSVALLVLNLGKKSNSTTSVSICSTNLPYEWNGLTCNSGGLYQITLTNNSGCDSVAQLMLDVTQAPLIYEVTGGGTYFSGGTGVLIGLSGSQSGINYQLQLNGSNVGLPLSGTGNAVSFGYQTQEGSYTVIAAPATICQLSMSGSVSVTINSNPPQSFEVTGGGYYCSNTNGVAVGLSGSEVGVDYQLLRSNGTLQVGQSVAGTGSEISFGLLSIADVYTVKAVNAINGSNGMMSGSARVRMVSSTTAPSTPGSISGPVNVCSYMGAGADYKIARVSNATSYLWTVPAGVTVIGMNTDTIIHVVLDATFTSGSISVVAVNACFNNAVSTARSITITKTLPTAPAAIYGPTDICPSIGTSAQTGPVRYYVRKVVNVSSYNWTVPAGVTLISGQGDTSVLLNFSSVYVSGSILVQSLSPCGNSLSTRALTVYKRMVSTPGTIQKEFSPSVPAVSSVCGLNTENYKIRKVNYALSYLWSLQNGQNATITHQNSGGVTDTAISVQFGAGFTKDSLLVRALNDCSVSSPRIFLLSALYVPPAVSSINGFTQPCIGDTIIYTASASLPSSSQSSIQFFRWTKPSKTQIISASSDSSVINLTYLTGFAGGALSVRGMSACGVTGSSKSLTLQYQTPAPTAINTSTGSVNACIGTTVTYTISVPQPSSSQRIASVYRWTKPLFTQILSASSDSASIVLQFNTGFTGGNLSVRGQTSCGVLSSAKTILLTHSGCSTGSKELLTSKSNQPLDEVSDVVVYPNPSRNMFEINAMGSGRILRYKILDWQGRQLVAKSEGSVSKIIVGDDLLPGAYVLEVVTEKTKKTIKILKQ